MQTIQYYRLRDLVQMAETGRLRPASFSRPQTWHASQIVDLFDSILHGYPIGTFIAIQEPAPEEDVVFGNIMIHALREERALIIVDGLQRITALVGTLSGMRSEHEDERYEIYYDINQGKFTTDTLVRDSKLPVYVAASGPALISWVREHPFLSEREVDSCFRLSAVLSEYMVPLITLAGNDARNTALEVFTRINTRGAALTKSDLAKARAGRFDTTSRGLERLQPEVERTGFGRISTSLAAECVLAVAEESYDIGDQGLPTQQRIMEMFQQMPATLQREAVDRARSVVIPTIQLLRQDAAIPHIRLLPRSVILPILMQYISIYDPPTGRTRELIRRWIWRCGTVSAANLRLKSSRDLDTKGTPLTAATKLLDSLPSHPGPQWRPDMSALKLSRIDGRLNVLALLSLRPHLLVPVDDLIEPADVPISATQIFSPWLDEASSAFSALLPRNYIESSPISLASYVLHPPVKQTQLLEAVSRMNSSNIDLLAGHCIDSLALGLLQRGDFDQFVEYRERQMFTAILRRVQSIARWGFRDHGRLPEVRDDLR
jgi:hypothetical protein